MVELEKEIEQVFSKDAHREEKCITIATSTIPAQYVLPSDDSEFFPSLHPSGVSS